MLNQVKVSVLPNGATVATSAMPTAESVALGIWVGVGGRHESARQSGASHFLEHMLFKGTRSRSSLAISRAIEGRGGYLNAFTQEESTCYYARLPHEFQKHGFEVLSDMYLNASLRPCDVKREREVILEEIKMYQDLPQYLAMEKMQTSTYLGHALGRPLIGEHATLSCMDHHFLAHFKSASYTPAATVFAFTGRVEHDACVDRVNNSLGHLPRRPPPRYKHIDNAVSQQRLSVIHRDTTQVHAALGFRIFGRHDDRRHALRVLNTILGENMSSRLFQRVRERSGLCYSIQSGYQLFEETGLFSITTGLDERRAEAALRLIARELREITTVVPGAQELKRAKDYQVGSFRLGLEGANSQMMHLGETLMNYGRIIHPEEVIAGIKAVTAEDVRRVAGDMFERTRMSLSLVVPTTMQQPDHDWLNAMESL